MENKDRPLWANTPFEEREQYKNPSAYHNVINQSKKMSVIKRTQFPAGSVSERNELLFDELRNRGLYVQKIGQEDDLRYLVVSCEEPHNLNQCSL